MPLAIQERPRSHRAQVDLPLHRIPVQEVALATSQVWKVQNPAVPPHLRRLPAHFRLLYRQASAVRVSRAAVGQEASLVLTNLPLHHALAIVEAAEEVEDVQMMGSTILVNVLLANAATN
jgi:hypothetical protein